MKIDVRINSLTPREGNVKAIASANLDDCFAVKNIRVVEGKNGLFSNEVLLAVAARYKKTVAQVVLRWLIQRGVVCIPKSVHAERIAENFDVFGFALDAEDMAVIASLDRPESSFLDHRDPETVEWLSNLH